MGYIYMYSNMWRYNYNLDLDVSKLMGFNRLTPICPKPWYLWEGEPDFK